MEGFIFMSDDSNSMCRWNCEQCYLVITLIYIYHNV